ncbi:MAG: MATE family efflux transporter [Azospira oryzae]|nr:MAG: MATE family efflux transporter [Azospira oryzae]PZP82425.1 MAG: MATE family efflux transporter [Azospira oryzae]
MDLAVDSSLRQFSRLPAVRFDAEGRPRVDLRAVGRLAVPLAANSALQAVLNLTDTWFIGRLSPDATAAIGAVHFLVIVCLLVVGGAGLAVQPLVAHAYGARRQKRASQAAWLGVWSALLTAPVFIGLAFAGPWILGPFGLAPAIHGAALDYWLPRLLGAPVGVLLWTLSAFFNGIGRTGVTLTLMAVVAVVNVPLNELLIFRLGFGMAGAAWATTLAMAMGATLALAAFLSRPVRAEYRSHLTWRPQWKGIRRLLALGLPTGLFPAVEVGAFWLFQVMMARLGAVDGAASQIAMVLTSVAYLPVVGLALAGTTLVGQSIGAGDKAWAARVGDTTIVLTVGYMGAVGVALALAGPWLVPLFVNSTAPDAQAVERLGVVLLWIAAGYQIFDGLNIGSSFCLRGAGDVRVPTVLLTGLAWAGFIPAVHIVAFAPGQGWIESLPALGLGSVGGWFAALLYIVAAGLALFARWRSGAWRSIRLA